MTERKTGSSVRFRVRDVLIDGETYIDLPIVQDDSGKTDQRRREIKSRQLASSLTRTFNKCVGSETSPRLDTHPLIEPFLPSQPRLNLPIYPNESREIRPRHFLIRYDPPLLVSPDAEERDVVWGLLLLVGGVWVDAVSSEGFPVDLSTILVGCFHEGLKDGSEPGDGVFGAVLL